MVPLPFPLRPFPLRLPRPAGFTSEQRLALNIGSEGFRCSEHISTLKNPGSERISAFLRVFGLFLGIRGEGACRGNYRLWLQA
jgi:hypothetical protein